MCEKEVFKCQQEDGPPQVFLLMNKTPLQNDNNTDFSTRTVYIRHTLTSFFMHLYAHLDVCIPVSNGPSVCSLVALFLYALK